MLTIKVPEREIYNEATNEFLQIPETTLRLEHSLVSISKWESKWKVPFLSKDDKTREQVIDYIKCMTTNQNIDPLVYRGITTEIMKEINDYISDPMTATWFKNETNKPGSRRVITSEIIYYWMIALNIPMDFQKWHFNRLMTLIQVCNEEQKPQKSLSKKELATRNSSINAARRAAAHSRG